MTTSSGSSRSAWSGASLLATFLALLVVAIAVAIALALPGLASLLSEQRYLEDGLWNLAIHTARNQLNQQVPGPALRLLVAGGLLLLLAAGLRRLVGPGPTWLRGLWPSALLRSRPLLAVAGALVLFAAAVNALSLYQVRVHPARSANVILIVVDTLRRDRLGAYGHPESPTPNLDAFASRAIRFDHAYSTSSWTRPAMASLLSSLSVAGHGISSEDPREFLGRATLTLPEILRQHNYRTAALVANPHYRFGLVQGFEFKWPPRDEGHTWADVMVDSALAFLKAMDGQPRFLLLHLIDPHDDYRYHPEFSRTPPTSPLRLLEPLLPVRRSPSGVTFESERNRQGTRRLGERELHELISNYEAEVAFTDHEIGRLFDYLEQSGRFRDSIVVVTADHGEEFLDHGSYWHGGTLYDELVKVPLLIRLPDHAAATIDERVSLIDLMPTLLDALGIEPPESARMQGTSLLPLIDGAALPRRPLFLATAFRGRTKYALIDGHYKWVRYAGGEPIGLFDLDRDPREQHDLREELPGEVRSLETLLAAHAEIYESNTRPLDPRSRFSDEELRALKDQLRALGYADEE